MENNKREVILKRRQQRAALAKMREVTEAFYKGAIMTNVHAFIEFTGLMNEFIKICEQTFQAGIDFSDASTHTSTELLIESHNLEYLAEKLNCIYGKSLTKPENRQAFLLELLEDYKPKKSIGS